MYTIKRKFRDSITMIAIKTNIKILLTNPKKIHNKVNNSSSRDVTTYLGHFLVGGYRCLGCKFLLNKITNKRNNAINTNKLFLKFVKDTTINLKLWRESRATDVHAWWLALHGGHFEAAAANVHRIPDKREARKRAFLFNNSS